MSAHVEWVDVENPFLGVTTQLRGERWDGQPADEYTHTDLIVPGEVGVVIAGDDAVVITGSFEKVEDLLRFALRKVQVARLEVQGG